MKELTEYGKRKYLPESNLHASSSFEGLLLGGLAGGRSGPILLIHQMLPIVLLDYPKMLRSLDIYLFSNVFLCQVLVHTWQPPWMWSRQGCKYRDQQLGNWKISPISPFLLGQYDSHEMNFYDNCDIQFILSQIVTRVILLFDKVLIILLFANQLQWVAGCYYEDMG